MAIDANSPISSSLHTGALTNISEQVTSGKRVNSGFDSPSDQALITALTTQSSTQNIATQNANTGISLLQTANGASSQIGESLLRLGELATQALNGTLSSQQRSMLNQEFQKNLEGIQQISDTTQFNGQNLLNGSNPSIDIALEDSSTTLSLTNLSTSSLSIDGLNIRNQSNASNALNGITSAIELISTQQSTFGAQQTGLTSAIDNIQNQNYNANRALSQINDTNYARAMTDQVRLQVLQDSAIAMQAQQNQSRSSVLQLLNS